jgi:hypothetical protein
VECPLLQLRKYIAKFPNFFEIKSGMLTPVIIFFFGGWYHGNKRKEKKNICMRFMLVKAAGEGHSRNKCLPKISALASTYLGNAQWHSKVHAMLCTCYVCIP